MHRSLKPTYLWPHTLIHAQNPEMSVLIFGAPFKDHKLT